MTPPAGPAVVTANPAARGHDWGGEGFVALAQAGEDVSIRFGHLPAGAAAPAWTRLAHTAFDGVGGLVHLLRAQGLAVAPPPMRRPRAPGAWRRLALLGADVGDRAPALPWRAFDPSARPGPEGPAALAWRVVPREAAAALEARARAAGASANSWLLAALDRALAPALLARPAPRLWMVPVNLRGAARGPCDTANLSSYLPVPVGEGGADAATVHAAVKRLLAGDLHWAVWGQVGAAWWIGRWAYRRAVRAYHARPGHPWLGAFSNLGAWPPGEGGADDGAAWVFAPPALKTLPVAAGAVTWQGRLGLTLQAHPALTSDPAEVEGWLGRWRAEAGLP